MWKRLLLLLFAALALSACGSKGKTYRIGVDANWYPLNLMGKEASIYAFTDELLRAISHEEEVFFERINVSWDNLILGLKENHYDGMLSSIAPRVFMQTVYEFSEPFLHTGPVLVVRSDVKVSSLGGMKGKEVAVNSLQTEALLLEIYPGVIPHYYTSIPEGLNAVIFNNIDAILVDYLLASSYIRDLYRGKVKIASPPLDDSGLRLLTLHGENKELITVFNRGLSKLRDNGTYEKLLKKWELN
jgi:polar amino acid transport system substrate-binding protein